MRQSSAFSNPFIVSLFLYLSIITPPHPTPARKARVSAGLSGVHEELSFMFPKKPSVFSKS